MFAIGDTVGLAEWIIDDTGLVFIGSSFWRRSSKFSEADFLLTHVSEVVTKEIFFSPYETKVEI